jgi:hypothetical protein
MAYASIFTVPLSVGLLDLSRVEVEPVPDRRTGRQNARNFDAATL